ncbi:hypothetical protein ACSNOK_12430 [Streptomyces sp. URMC 126]|uniref:hypothetical protein n=1 Tax=Streptomyces sp. URMC 126 TaxID=3423401 RepID=UPI003F1C4F6C
MILGVGMPVAILAIGAGAFFAWGGFERIENARSVEEACQGALPKGDLSAFLEADRLRAEQRPDKVRGLGWLDQCVVLPHGKKTGLVELNIGWSHSSRLARSRLTGDAPVKDAVNDVPFGHGWSGVIRPGGVGGEAAVVLPCRGAGKGLLVSVSAFRWNRTEPLSHDRLAMAELARLTTGTAVRAADKLGCEAVPGETVGTVDPPPPVGGNVPLDRAKGTCRALKPVGDAVASVGGRGLEETAAPDGPIEDCYITDRQGERLYHLGAFYGPYAQDLFTNPPGHQEPASPVDERTGDSWAAAECRDFFGRARFTLTSVRGEYPSATSRADRPAQQALLAAFAREAVKRHGCSDLTLPRLGRR